jgi:putative transposase
LQLVEQHIITKENDLFREIDHLAFLSKNLYNAALYRIKTHYVETKKFLRYKFIEDEFRNSNQRDYRALPGNTSQQILMVLDKNLKSFFEATKSYRKNPKKFKAKPEFPNYKHKTKGRNLLVFTINQAKLKDGIITLPKKIGFNFNTKVENMQQVRIIPKSSHYTLEVVYTKQEKELKTQKHFLSIDIGVNNLATCYDTRNNKSFIINGKPLKSINQFYNKEKAKLQSELKKVNDKHWSRKLDSLNDKRNRKIKDYLHNSSRFIVNYCFENNLNTNWKQNLVMNKKNAQNFSYIPFYTFLNQLEYKSKLEGIDFSQTEESYTSVCSFLDDEALCKHEVYLGKRISRGMFRTFNRTLINSDINGALNILKKTQHAVANKVLENLKQTLSNRDQVEWSVKIDI